MHLVPDTLGRFPLRPYYPHGEIDLLMEKLLDSVERPRLDGRDAIDIEKVMMRLGAEPEYGNLPEGLEGLAIFAGDGHSRIVISTELADMAKDDPAVFHRLRTTLSHEFGHVKLHSRLFANKPLAPSATRGLAIPYASCRGGGGKYAGWWEWQANTAMAALLMPRDDFQAATRRWRRGQSAGMRQGGWAAVAYEAYISAMSHAFEVSREAAAYRAEALGYFHPNRGWMS